MTDQDRTRTQPPGVDEDEISRPRLTPQGRDAPEPGGEDATDPAGGAKKGQGDKAEG
ncbi:hypothetical protein [Methylobacterium variabile]|jgi:hypothetical protein|uniref:hypothetical protein n=1 Tax=Methylobacterium variabile TaxID=298794 RepID=UPI000B1D12F9|nr:hypothetical protein [Methylobacterium variabile]